MPFNGLLMREEPAQAIGTQAGLRQEGLARSIGATAVRQGQQLLGDAACIGQRVVPAKRLSSGIVPDNVSGQSCHTATKKPCEGIRKAAWQPSGFGSEARLC